jgi:hypothetical protein
MNARLKIPRGAYQYDETELLGSRFGPLFRVPIGRSLEELSTMIREALAPMDDVEILDVTLEEESGQIQALVKYSTSPTHGDITDELEDVEQGEVNETTVPF